MAPRAGESPPTRPEPAALVAFLLALGAGGACLYAVPAAWLAPTVPVVLFAAFLRVALGERRRPLDRTLESSPASLGLLLTLIALAALLLRYRPAPGSEPAELSYGLGTALAPAIAGLVARQIVVLSVPRGGPPDAEPERADAPTRAPRAELQTPQRELAAVLEDFLAQREELMATERAASQRYVKGVRSTLRSLQRVQDRLHENIETSARHSSEVLAESHGALMSSVAETAESLEARTRAIRDRLSTLEEEIGRASRGIREAAPGAELDALRAASAETTAAMRQLGDAGKVLGKTAAESSRAAQAIRDDLKAVDSILSEFVEIAAQRIRELGQLDGRP